MKAMLSQLKVDQAFRTKNGKAYIYTGTDKEGNLWAGYFYGIDFLTGWMAVKLEDQEVELIKGL